MKNVDNKLAEVISKLSKEDKLYLLETVDNMTLRG